MMPTSSAGGVKGIRMRVRIGVLCVTIGMLCLSAVIVARADEPAFVRWLSAGEPGDETIRDYWERAEREELTAAEFVDLGTMVFYRGFPTDSLGLYKKALDLDPGLYEAWFRIGLVEHKRYDLDKARQAYRRCLKKRPGHGWCNFYLGLLEEQLGHSTNALEHYERSFRHAPELADPRVNPEVLNSKLVLGARLIDFDERRFEAALPMKYLQPARVRRVRQQYEPTPVLAPTLIPEPGMNAEKSADGSSAGASGTQGSVPEPTATPKPRRPPRSIPARRVTPSSPTPTVSEAPGAGYSDRSTGGVPTVPIGNTSNEAHLMPWWPRLSQTAMVLVQTARR
jgi:hypothetical protein